MFTSAATTVVDSQETLRHYVSGRQIPSLDGVRGIAVLIVVLHHLQYVVPYASTGWGILKGAFYIGWTGVDLFFVLSGFLITGILLDTRPASNYFRSFYARRTLRIFPLYYAVLSGILLINTIAGSAWLHSVLPTPSDQKPYFVFLNNWWLLLHGKAHANMIGHFWSLAVEEQFYLMWSLCVWLVPSRHLWKLCVSTFFIVFIVRAGILSWAGPSQHLLENTFMRMDTLLAGSACAILVRNRDLLAKIEPRLGVVACAALLGVEAILVRGGELFHAALYTESIGFSLIAIGYSTLVIYAYQGRKPGSIPQRMLCSKILTRFGKYSFGIYVYHVPVLLVAEQVTHSAFPAIFRNPWTALLYISAVIGITFLVARTSYEFFEKRFLAYKNRFAPVYPREAMVWDASNTQPEIPGHLSQGANYAQIQ